MKAPQIIFIGIFFISLLLVANKHGKPKTGNENFWINFAAVIIEILILWWGGFWGIK